jgi:hypothetical protein
LGFRKRRKEKDDNEHCTRIVRTFMILTSDRILVGRDSCRGKDKDKRSLVGGNPTHEWEDNTKNSFQEFRRCGLNIILADDRENVTGCEYDNELNIILADDRENMTCFCENGNEIPAFIKIGVFLSSCGSTSFSMTLFEGVN